LIDNVTCEIGGTTIDKQYGEWMYIWDQLAGDRSNKRGLDAMIGNVPELTELSEVKEKYTLYIPLYFWFCRNNGLALPLIALQYHEVKIKVHFRSANETIIYKNGTKIDTIDLDDASLLVNYVYLDSEERKRFAQASHEYLIEQVQFTGQETITGNSNKIRLNFNHPCKFLAWGVKRNQGSVVQRPVWNTNSENMKELYGRLVALLSHRHDKEKQVLDDTSDGDGTGEGVRIHFKEGSCNFALLSEKVEAIVAITNDESSTDSVALMMNKLTSADISKDLCELKTIYEDAITNHVDITAMGSWTAADSVAQIQNVSHLWEHFVNTVNPFGFSRWVDDKGNPFEEAQLQLNGHDRFAKMDGNYFNYVQPFQHFSNTPADGINVYSFALNPEEHQPSGSCNMSRIDNATMSLYSQHEGAFYIFAVNYNVLRIMSGMGGLAYSN